jgi:hypothetical protein
MQIPLQYLAQYLPMVGEPPPVLRRLGSQFSEEVFVKLHQAWSLGAGFFTFNQLQSHKVGVAATVAASLLVFLIFLAAGMSRFDNHRTDVGAGDIGLPNVSLGFRGLASACAVGALLALVFCLTFLARSQPG